MTNSSDQDSIIEFHKNAFITAMRNKLNTNSIEKAKDLDLLQSFCKKDKVQGWCSNIWFGGLITRYPWHFLLFSQYSEKNTFRRNNLKEKIAEKLFRDLDSILVEPITQKELDLLQIFIKEIEAIADEKKANQTTPLKQEQKSLLELLNQRGISSTDTTKENLGTVKLIFTSNIQQPEDDSAETMMRNLNRRKGV